MKKIPGAGGTEGGVEKFFIGLIMMIAGGYLFLNNIQVTNNFRFGFGAGLFTVKGFSIASGYIL